MGTVLGSPQRPSSHTTAPANAEPTPFEVFIAMGNILTWLLAVYLIYLHVQARWDLEARYLAHIEAQRQAWSEAEKQWRNPHPAENRARKRKLQQIQEEIEEDQNWGDEVLDWHGEIEDVAAREAEVDTNVEIEEGMEIMEIPSRQEFGRDYEQSWRW